MDDKRTAAFLLIVCAAAIVCGMWLEARRQEAIVQRLTLEASPVIAETKQVQALAAVAVVAVAGMVAVLLVLALGVTFALSALIAKRNPSYWQAAPLQENEVRVLSAPDPFRPTAIVERQANLVEIVGRRASER